MLYLVLVAFGLQLVLGGASFRIRPCKNDSLKAVSAFDFFRSQRKHVTFWEMIWTWINCQAFAEHGSISCDLDLCIVPKSGTLAAAARVKNLRAYVKLKYFNLTGTPYLGGSHDICLRLLWACHFQMNIGVKKRPSFVHHLDLPVSCWPGVFGHWQAVRPAEVAGPKP